MNNIADISQLNEKIPSEVNKPLIEARKEIVITQTEELKSSKGSLRKF